MNFSKNSTSHLMGPICFRNIILIFFISLSVSSVLAQGTGPKQKSNVLKQKITTNDLYSEDDLLEEKAFYDDNDYPYELAPGAQVRTWVVAEHINSLWKIWAQDAVSGDILTGITAINIDVVREGLIVGDFAVTGKTGYGVLQSPGACTVSIACEQKITIYTGIPPIGRAYLRYHTY